MDVVKKLLQKIKGYKRNTARCLNKLDHNFNTLRAHPTSRETLDNMKDNSPEEGVLDLFQPDSEEDDGGNVIPVREEQVMMGGVHPGDEGPGDEKVPVSSGKNKVHKVTQVIEVQQEQVRCESGRGSAGAERQARSQPQDIHPPNQTKQRQLLQNNIRTPETGLWL